MGKAVLRSAAAAAMAAALLAPSVPAQAAPAPLYRIHNANSGKCLVVRGAASNNPAVQTTCGYYADQYWGWSTVNGNTLIVNDSSEKCLVSRASESQAVQSTCNRAYADQNWDIDIVGADGAFFRLKNKATGLCLVARGEAGGAPVVKTTCGNYRDQYWFSSR